MAIWGSSNRLFRTAVRGLRRHMMRSVLSGLGIVIGVAVVIAMMEIGQGSSSMIQETIAPGPHRGTALRLEARPKQWSIGSNVSNQYVLGLSDINRRREKDLHLEVESS
jgi:ABC-type antimicrobial peptide transport system permease subunit